MRLPTIWVLTISLSLSLFYLSLCGGKECLFLGNVSDILFPVFLVCLCWVPTLIQADLIRNNNNDFFLSEGIEWKQELRHVQNFLRFDFAVLVLIEMNECWKMIFPSKLDSSAILSGMVQIYHISLWTLMLIVIQVENIGIHIAIKRVPSFPSLLYIRTHWWAFSSPHNVLFDCKHN